MQCRGLRAKTVVDYMREPFIYVPGNVRVTLDGNIRTALRRIDAFSPDLVTVPAGEDVIVLEVKWDEYLPSVIRDIIQLPAGAQLRVFKVCGMPHILLMCRCRRSTVAVPSRL